MHMGMHKRMQHRATKGWMKGSLLYLNHRRFRLQLVLDLLLGRYPALNLS